MGIVYLDTQFAYSTDIFDVRGRGIADPRTAYLLRRYVFNFFPGHFLIAYFIFLFYFEIGGDRFSSLSLPDFLPVGMIL